MRDLFGDFQTLCSNSAWKKCTFFFFPSEEEESETTPKKKLKSSRRKKKIAFSLKVQRRAETLTGGYLENTASEDAAATVYTKANIEINLSPTITTSRKETFSMAMAHNCALGNNNRKSIRGKEKKKVRDFWTLVTLQIVLRSYGKFSFPTCIVRYLAISERIYFRKRRRRDSFCSNASFEGGSGSSPTWSWKKH